MVSSLVTRKIIGNWNEKTRKRKKDIIGTIEGRRVIASTEAVILRERTLGWGIEKAIRNETWNGKEGTRDIGHGKTTADRNDQIAEWASRRAKEVGVPKKPTDCWRKETITRLTSRRGEKTEEIVRTSEG